MKRRSKVIARPIETINFGLLARCYQRLRWRWTPLNSIPNSIELKEFSERLLWMCEEGGSISSGGMEIDRYDIQVKLRLDRAIEKEYAPLLNAEEPNA